MIIFYQTCFVSLFLLSYFSETQIPHYFTPTYLVCIPKKKKNQHFLIFLQNLDTTDNNS